MKKKRQTKYSFPDKDGRFGNFGGKYVSETLITALDQLEEVYSKAKKDKLFLQEVINDLNNFVGRPSPLYFAERWTKKSPLIKQQNLRVYALQKYHSLFSFPIYELEWY